jgi:hypothetical protein
MTPDFRALCVELTDDLEGWIDGYLINDPADEHTAASFERINRARALLAKPDGPAVSDDREPASATDQITHQLHRRATVLLIRKVIDQAIRDTASVQWRVADTGEQLVRASDLVAWADHMEKQMAQLSD